MTEEESYGSGTSERFETLNEGIEFESLDEPTESFGISKDSNNDFPAKKNTDDTEGFRVMRKTLAAAILLLIVAVLTLAVVSVCLFTRKTRRYAIEAEVSEKFDDVYEKFSMIKGNSVIVERDPLGRVLSASVNEKILVGHYPDGGERVNFTMFWNASDCCNDRSVIRGSMALCNVNSLVAVCDLGSPGVCVFAVVEAAYEVQRNTTADIIEVGDKRYAMERGNVNEANVYEKVTAFVNLSKIGMVDPISDGLDNLSVLLGREYFTSDDVLGIVLKVLTELEGSIV